MGFDETPTVCQLFSNCLSYLMLLLMTCLCSSMFNQGGRVYLMRSSREEGLVSPISCPVGFVVVAVCQDDHQKMKGSVTRHGSWVFVPHLKRSGDATRIVATWCVLTSGVNAPIV